MPNDLAKIEPREVAAPQLTGAALFEALMRRADQNPEHAREMYALAREVRADLAREEYNRSFAEMHPHLPVVKKNGLIGRVNKDSGKVTSTTPFAKWDDIYRACMPILRQYGFTVSFDSEYQAGALTVICRSKHSGGHEEIGRLAVPWLDAGGAKSPSQQAASSFTLAQRHAFLKMFNILTEDQDDDGSGQGTPERITEKQYGELEAMLVEADTKREGSRRRFLKYIKEAWKADSPAQLLQGDQHAGAISLLQQMLGAK